MLRRTLGLLSCSRRSGGGTPTPTPTPAPSFSVQPSITGTPQVGVSFVGTPGTASNTTSHTYRWLLSTTSGGTYAAISGATSASYTPVSGDETKYLKFEDTATGPTAPPAVATTTFAGPISAAAAIDAPVLSNLTTGWASGQNPPLWKSTYPNVQGYNSFSGAGDQVRAHWKLGAGAWTATAWEPLDDELATGDAPAWPFLTDGSLAAGGAFQVWEEIVRDLGLATEQTSVPSNTWTDTIAPAAALATWDPAAKYSAITLSNGNLTAACTTDSANQGVRATLGRASSATASASISIDAIVSGGSTNFYFGLCHTADTVTDGSAPSYGVFIAAGTWGWELHNGASLVTSNYTARPGFAGISFAMSGGAVQMYVDGGAAGAPQTPPAGTGNLYPFASVKNGGAVTINLGSF